MGKKIMTRLRTMAACALLLSAPTAYAADQTVPGPGNATAEALAQKSPLVQSALTRLQRLLKRVADRALRQQTEDALFNRKTCVAHRVNVDLAKKQAILAQLRAEGLYSDADATAFPGGALIGVFPPLASEGACPQLPQAFGAAPGSGGGSHHSYPGGLANHEAFNTAIALGFADNYKLAYGTPGADGLPRMVPLPTYEARRGDLDISQDEIIAAPMWHDWAKPIVFQWNADGSEFAEFNFGGNGATDAYGKAGDSRTGGHHIVSLAESIARNLPAEFIVAQASAHSAPTLGNEYKVVNWIRTAAIMAQVDPVARGYLYRDTTGALRLPPRDKSGEINLNAAGQTNVFVEDTIHNLSDADFVFSIPAVAQAQVLIANVAARYGYDPADVTRYNTKYRNPAFSYLSAERLLIIYKTKGIAGVQKELDILRKKQVI